jgi:hypothetical protein
MVGKPRCRRLAQAMRADAKQSSLRTLIPKPVSKARWRDGLKARFAEIEAGSSVPINETLHIFRRAMH